MPSLAFGAHGSMTEQHLWGLVTFVMHDAFFAMPLYRPSNIGLGYRNHDHTTLPRRAPGLHQAGGQGHRTLDSYALW